VNNSKKVSPLPKHLTHFERGVSFFSFVGERGVVGLINNRSLFILFLKRSIGVKEWRFA
jgi:hypothetical protein